MRLLIITQKVDRNDPILGFFHRWIEEFAKYCEQTTVICLGRGVYDLPEVKVLSLGKESNPSRLKYLWRFYKYLWQERKNYDTVLVHMNPIYIVLAGWFWKLSKKPIHLWYTHRQVDLKLKVAEKFVRKIFTAAEESLLLTSDKKVVMGHGIDLEKFDCVQGKDDSRRMTILHVGRLTRIKNCQILLLAAKLLKEKGVDFVVKFIGGPATTEDQEYFSSLRKFVRDENLDREVEFVGSIPNYKMSDYYCHADLTVNLAPTGGIDKAVLESLASGVSAIVFNKAFDKYLGRWSEALLLKEQDPVELSEKIIALRPKNLKEKIGSDIKEAIRTKIGLNVLIQKLLIEME